MTPPKKKTYKGFQDKDLHPAAENVMKKKSVISTHQEIPKQAELGGASEPQRSVIFGTQKAKQRTFTTDIAAELPSLEGTRMTLPMKESRVGVLRLRLGCQIPGRGLWLAAVRICSSGYLDTVEGVQRKDQSYQSGKKSLSAGYLLHIWLPKLAKLVRVPAVELGATATAKAWENKCLRQQTKCC